MSNQGKNIFLYLVLILLLTNCDVNHSLKSDENYKKSINLIGEKEYYTILAQLNDTLSMWIYNKLRCVEAETTYPFKIDSLLCFDKHQTRFVTCRHLSVNVSGASSDDLRFYYGEKISGHWFFFQGASIVISRTTIKGHDVNTPLSYKQLHEIALKEVYSGYLTSSGEINEEWFTEHFENVGWCSTCKTKEDFQKSKLEGVAMLWRQRDTTQPIKLLPKKDTLIP